MEVITGTCCGASTLRPREGELGGDAGKMASGWSAGRLRGHLGDDVLAVLMPAWTSGCSCRGWAG
ncbi:hypothetical protein ACFVJM_34620 [Streptomyces virginiae]|uniref:hypothetical protein n=1 Tax=Streptomyces virginiae TaxID=1961 RepID=UPI003636AF3A